MSLFSFLFKEKDNLAIGPLLGEMNLISKLISPEAYRFFKYPCDCMERKIKGMIKVAVLQMTGNETEVMIDRHLLFFKVFFRYKSFPVEICFRMDVHSKKIEHRVKVDITKC